MKQIADIQREVAESEAKQAVLANGQIAGSQAIAEWVVERYGEINYGQPTCTPYRQERGQKLNAQALFNFMRTTGFDIKVLHQALNADAIEAVDDAIRNSERFFDLLSKIDELERRERRVRLIIDRESEDAEYINIDLISDVRADQTTLAVDPLANHLSLRMAALKTRRILNSHMKQAMVPSMSIEGVEPRKIVRNTPVQGQSFRNCVVDSHSPWLQELATEGYSGPLTISCSLQVSPDPIGINRIELEPVSGSCGSISVEYSESNQFTLVGMQPFHQKLVFSDDITARSIRIKFILDGPAYQNGGESIYLFGLTAFRLFNAGYSREGQMVTNMLTVDRDFIQGARLRADEQIPAGIEAEYYLKFGNQWVETDWQRIAPWHRLGSSIPRAINTQSAYQYSGSAIPVDDQGVPQNRDDNGDKIYPYLYTHSGGLDFWVVGSIPSDRQVQANAKLYRGVGGWQYQTDKYMKSGQTRNHKIKLDDSRKITALVTDQAVIQTGSPNKLRVSHPIFYSEGQALTPAGNAVYAIKWAKKSQSASPTRTYGGRLIAGSIRYLETENYTATASVEGLILLIATRDGQSIYVRALGMDDDKIQVEVISPSIWPTTNTNVEYWEITGENLTPLIDTVRTSSTDPDANPYLIELKSGATLSSQDQVEVRYRTAVGRDSGIVIDASTFEVRDAEGNLLTEGQDYEADLVEGEIISLNERLTELYLSFDYQRQTTDLYILSAWFHSRVGQLVIGDLPVQPDEQLGEGVYVDTTDGRQAVSDGLVIDLTEGWHRWEIRGRTPERMESLRQLTDSSGAIVLSPGKWFDRQLAFQQPLDLRHISNLKGRAKPGSPDGWALVGNLIIVPFSPSANPITDRFYNVYKGSLDRQVDEQFLVNYQYVTDRQVNEPTVIPETVVDNGFAPPLRKRHVYDRLWAKVVLKSQGEDLRAAPVIRNIAVDIL